MPSAPTAQPAMARGRFAQEIAAAILEYKAAGISQFILSGWPKLASMEFFGTHILPIVRRMECESSGSR